MNEHYLFSDDIYDNIKMVYKDHTVQKVKYYWKKGYSAEIIAGKINVSDVEIFLLIADLQITGKLPQRDTDYYGRRLKKWVNID